VHGGDRAAAGGADGGGIVIVIGTSGSGSCGHVLLDALLAEAVAARGEDAQGVLRAGREADAAGELEALVGLLRGQAVVLLVSSFPVFKYDVMR
jgi:hypothetical protein